MSAQKNRMRVSLGISLGDTVPLWGHGTTRLGWKRLFYVFGNRPDEHSYGCTGFKAGCVFVRITYGRKVKKC